MTGYFDRFSERLFITYMTKVMFIKIFSIRDSTKKSTYSIVATLFDVKYYWRINIKNFKYLHMNAESYYKNSDNHVL